MFLPWNLSLSVPLPALGPGYPHVCLLTSALGPCPGHRLNLGFFLRSLRSQLGECVPRHAIPGLVALWLSHPLQSLVPLVPPTAGLISWATPPPGPLQSSQPPPASSMNFSTWRQDALGMRTRHVLLNAFPRLAWTPGSSMVVHRALLHLAATWCLSSLPGSLWGPEIQHPSVPSGPLCVLLPLALPGVFCCQGHFLHTRLDFPPLGACG